MEDFKFVFEQLLQQHQLQLGSMKRKLYHIKIKLIQQIFLSTKDIWRSG